MRCCFDIFSCKSSNHDCSCKKCIMLPSQLELIGKNVFVSLFLRVRLTCRIWLFNLISTEVILFNPSPRVNIFCVNIFCGSSRFSSVYYLLFYCITVSCSDFLWIRGCSVIRVTQLQLIGEDCYFDWNWFLFLLLFLIV